MNAFNRVLWTVIGVVLAVVGVIALLANRGIVPLVNRNSEIISPTAGQRWHSWPWWAPAIAIVLAGIIGLFGLWLLRAQFTRGSSRDALPDLVSVQDGPGRTRVTASTLNHVLSRDLHNEPSVRRASVRLLGAVDDPSLVVRLAVTPDADLSAVARHLDRTMDRFVATTGLSPQLSEVVVRMGGTEPPRVPADNRRVLR